jgi:hypothetical protein
MLDPLKAVTLPSKLHGTVGTSELGHQSTSLPGETGGEEYASVEARRYI